LEFWRQLWRALEFSDICIQVVDARCVWVWVWVCVRVCACMFVMEDEGRLS